jgi:alkylation response protein AidB-like acyl-CoA dehydrogenase
MSITLEYSAEQHSMRQALRRALERSDTVADARRATQSGLADSQWDLCRAFELPGLLSAEAVGGAQAGLAETLVSLEELGRALACHPLRGHLLATLLLEAAGRNRAELASGARRACAVLNGPGPAGGAQSRPVLEPAAGGWVLTGAAEWVPDAVDADVFVVMTEGDGRSQLAEVEAGAPGVTVEPTIRYDSTTNLGRVSFDHAAAIPVAVADDQWQRSWAASQAMMAATALGVARACLELATGHAKLRYAFGRPIGSYQAIKHGLVEVLRLIDNAESCLLWAGSCWTDAPDEMPLAAAAARSSAGRAEALAAQTSIFVHGGMGATWEHDAPYFYRRSQLSRLLLGGTGGASEEVGRLLIAAEAGAEQ